jgi:uncharacterized membrane protein YhhN
MGAQLAVGQPLCNTAVQHRRVAALRTLQIGLGLAALLAIGSARIWRLGHPLTLTLIASSCFVAIALLAGPGRDGYGRWMLAGIVGCWLGDLLGPIDFLWGLYAFLAAHVLFSLAGLRRGVSRGGLLVGAAMASCATLAFCVSTWGMMAPEQRPALIAYAVVISVMLTVAVGSWHHARHAGGWCLLVGAVLFYASDVVLGLWHFLGDRFPLGRWCYLIYYPAVCTLGASIGPRADRCGSAQQSGFRDGGFRDGGYEAD